MEEFIKYSKIIIYNKEGNIKYEGGFFNGHAEGYGKYILDNGDYYLGDWKNGIFIGKGIIYYMNGNIEYKVNELDE